MPSVTIQLPLEIEQQLREVASQSGKSLEVYLQELAERAAMERRANGVSTPSTSVVDLPLEQWLAEWRAFIGRSRKYPVIADDSRESIYEGRGE
jgi:hypothetical protein